MPVKVINLIGNRSPENETLDKIDALIYDEAEIEKLTQLFIEAAKYRK